MIATTNISLNVPFNEKDQAKALGARWNAEAKHWYVQHGIEAAPFEKWFTNAPTQATSQAVEKMNPEANSASTNIKPLDDDFDAINARLRDAYESLGDPF